MFGGSSRKKLAALSAQADQLQRETDGCLAEAAGLRREIQAAEALDQELDAGRGQRRDLEAEEAALAREAEEIGRETAALRERIGAECRAAAEAGGEREAAMAELDGLEVLARQCHEDAAAATATAVRRAAELLEEQEAEGQRLQAARGAHEALRREVEAGTEACEQALVERDRAREALVSAQDQVDDLGRGQRHLAEESTRAAGQLQRQEGERDELGEEVRALEAECARAVQGLLAAEEERRQRQFALAAAREELGARQRGFQRELVDFEEQLHGAGCQQEQVAEEHGRLREALSALLPEHFRLQAEQACRGSELERARQEREQAAWEHHQLGRDLAVLARSYDTGLALPLPAPAS